MMSYQNFQSTEGIILRVIPFREYDQILSLFTFHAGLIKVMYKRSRQSRETRLFCMPLTKVEIVYREQNGEIFSCHDLACVDSFSELRKEWVFLEVGCDLLQAISTSQLLGKAAPSLYLLLCFYLSKISQTAYPWVLSASFRLKLLKHDGLMSFPLKCLMCGQSLQEKAFTRNSECWCANHRLEGTQIWDSKELQMLDLLANSLSYQELSSHNILPDLMRKIMMFFDP